MQPIPEAVAWSLRADAWAQNPDTPGEQSGTVSRWSDVAATGRPALPADGVGWRTQTSEWRSTADSARWRQTTEWRSATGSHGWRTTTEAWQSGDAENIPPQAEPPTRIPAISGTAWPTPATDDQPGSTPTWQSSDATPAWQQPGEPRQSQPSPTPPWEPARGDDRPGWQQFTSSGPTPPWQPADAPPSRQRDPESRPSWESQPSWQAFTESSRPSAEPTWREPAQPAASWQTPPTSAPTSYSGSWSTPIDDGRHLVREDDRAAWRESAAGQARPADGPAPGGRRRAADSGSRTTGGTGWTVRSDADNWAGHTDTGSMPAFQDPAASTEPSWRRGSTEPPAQDGWRTSTTTNSWQSSPPVTESWRSGDQSRTDQARTESWRLPPATEGWRSGDESRANEARTESWRDTGSWRRDPAAGPPVDPWAQSSAETGIIPLPAQPRDRDAGGWQSRTETSSWQQGTDTGSWQRDGESRRGRGDTGSWQREPENGRTDTGSWRAGPDSGSRADAGSWQREPEAGGRQSRIEPGSWQQGPESGPGSWQRAPESGRTDTGSWRGGADSGSRADTGSWQRGPDSGRTDSWQRGADNGSWQRGPENGRTDTGSWQRGFEAGGRGEAASWQQGAGSERAADGRSDTGSWRRDEVEPPRSSRSSAPRRGGEIERWPGAQPAADPRRVPEPGAEPRRGAGPRDFEAPRGPEPRRGRDRRDVDAPRGPEPRRAVEGGQRSGGLPRGFEGQRGPAVPRRAESPRGPESQRDYADRGRRRERDTSWQRELESGAWHRDPESDVWLRDSDTGQWHRQELEDDEDDEDDRGPRRGPRTTDRGSDGGRGSGGPDGGARGSGGGGRRAIESRAAVSRRDRDEPARSRSEPDDDGAGRRRAAAPRTTRLQLTAGPEAPLDPEVWRLDDDEPTRPIAARSPGRRRDSDIPVSAQPAAWQRETDRPTSAAPDQRRRGAAIDPDDEAYEGRPSGRPGSTLPDDRRRDAEPTARSRDGGSATRSRDDEPTARARDAGSSARTRDDEPTARMRDAGSAARTRDDEPTARTRDGGSAARSRADEAGSRARDVDPASAPPDQRPRGIASVAGPETWRRDAETPARPVSGTAAVPVSPEPGAWRAEAQVAARTDAWRNQLRAEQGEPPLVSDAVTEIRPRGEPDSWRQPPPDESGPGSAPYREGNTGDWRRDLAAGGDLADGESRRISTASFVPFRPPSKNGAAASVKVPAANSATQGATEVIQRTGARWQDPPDTQWPPRGAVATAAGTYERRPVSTLPAPSARQNDLLEPDEELEEDTGGPLAAVGYTVVWYGVPVVLFVLYMLVLNGTQQAQALETLAGAAPQFGLSLVLSMLVAVGLRWASGSWKAASVGLAAAVMGGGLATVLTSAITGQSLS